MTLVLVNVDIGAIFADVNELLAPRQVNVCLLHGRCVGYSDGAVG